MCVQVQCLLCRVAGGLQVAQDAVFHRRVSSVVALCYGGRRAGGREKGLGWGEGRG